MKKQTLAKVATLALALAAGSAFAADKGWYMGADIGQSRNDLSSPKTPAPRLDKTDTAYGVHGGYQFNKYFAAELGVNRLGTQKIGDSKATTKAYSLDAIGRLPVSDKFTVYGRLGGAHMERTYSDDAGNHAAGFKVGLGAEYAIDPSWSLRTELTRYNNVPTSSTFGNTLDSWNVGVNYRF
ncbi:outer membrane beta-barrel protein [Paucibacter sp. AS339]|uniref:porin family protein n=1 Tax=Paucibacter hankyongi TaxID=3133434 RepID=UPI0030B15C22